MADRKAKIPAIPALQASHEVLLGRKSLEKALSSLISLPQVNNHDSNEEGSERQAKYQRDLEPKRPALHAETLAHYARFSSAGALLLRTMALRCFPSFQQMLFAKIPARKSSSDTLVA